MREEVEVVKREMRVKDDEIARLNEQVDYKRVHFILFFI